MVSDDIEFQITFKDIVNENGDSYQGYGFIAYRNNPPAIIFQLDDISCCKNDVEQLVSLIRDNDVSVKHFEDVVDDFLT